MGTQHRQQKEKHNNFKPKTALERFYNGISSGNIPKAAQILEEIEKHPPHGLWMHRALALALEGPRDNVMEALDMLFSSRTPPHPTEQSDFIMLAVKHNAPDAALRLFEAGFRGTPATQGHMLGQMKWGFGVDKKRMRASYISNAPIESVVNACARAVVANDPKEWLMELNAALPKPLPGREITRAVLYEMVNKRGRMNEIPRQGLDLARDLWWVDHNMAQLEYDDRLHARNYQGAPQYDDVTLALYGEALSMIARSGLEEEPGPEPVARATPRKRL